MKTGNLTVAQWDKLATKGWVTFPKRAKYVIATPEHPEAGECDPVTLEVNDGTFYVQGVIVKALALIGGVMVDTGAGWRDAVNAVEKAIAGSWHASATLYAMEQDDSFMGNNLPPNELDLAD